MNAEIIYIWISISACLWIQNGGISCVDKLRMQKH